MSASDRLDEIEARTNAATETEWWTTVVPSQRLADYDWEFIAHAREDVPQLVAALRAALDREALAAALFEFEGIGLGWSGPFAEGTYAPKSAVGHAYARADVIIARVESALGGA